MRARWALLPLLLLAAAPTALSAQAVTGALEGRVLSTGGEALDNAIVTVSGPFLQGARSLATDARGRFIFLALPPGAYAVQVRRMGFRPTRLGDVAVRLGSTASVGEVRLDPAVVEVAAIEVSGERPLIDPVSTAEATARDSSFFRKIPTPRDFLHLADLAPLAAPSPTDGANGSSTIGGATESENGYYIDGVDVSGLGEVVTSQRALPFNFVREIQVLTGGYEAEYGRAQGGVLNAVTNSGGNTFRGQVLGMYTGNALRATPRWGYSQAQLPTFRDWDVGFSLSGPIRRDRLWYFVAYEPTVFSRDVAYTGLATQQDRTTQHLVAGKLTWRAGDFTDVILTALGDPKVQRIAGDPGLEQVASADAVLGEATGGGWTFALQMRRQRGRTLLTASVARSDEGGFFRPRAPHDDVLSLSKISDYTTNTVSGNFGIDSYGRNHRTAVQVALTYAGERHTLKAGAEYQDNYSLIVARWSLLSITSDPAHPYQWTTVDQRLEGVSRVPSLYLQDSWAFTEKLRVNAGIRWDGNWLSGPNGLSWHIVNQISPRLGAVYQPDATGRSKVTASWGRYYQQIPPYSAGIWGGTGYYLIRGYAANPLTQSATGDTMYYFSAIGRPDAQIRGQHHDELSVGYERVLGDGLKLGLRGIARTLRWVIDDAPVGANGANMFGNPGRGALAALPRATREYRALEVTLERSTAAPFAFLASYVLSRNRGSYPGLFEEDMPTAAGGSNAGWGYDQPDTNGYRSGVLPNDRTHLLKLVGSYRFGATATMGATFLAASGTPRSEMGQSVWGAPYVVFVKSRGSLGRTPWIWDLNLRGTYALPLRGQVRPRLVLDVFHVGNPRRAVWYDDLHYNSSQDGTGAWGSTNPNYGKVQMYQKPMSARLGMQIDF